MSKSKEIVTELMASAGVQVNGIKPYDIQIHNENLYDRALSLKSLGLGEAYMDGWWDCERLDEFVSRILQAGIAEKTLGSWKLAVPFLRAFLFNLQSVSRARMIAYRHYNLDNDLFLSFLDPYNQYSCAYFKETDDLTQAQINKMDLIIAKLKLAPCRSCARYWLWMGWTCEIHGREDWLQSYRSQHFRTADQIRQTDTFRSAGKNNQLRFQGNFG